ncbi:MAG: GntR family transcriptional regulator [Sphaerobacter sp.]|nr:GntR family transcriptional regulator [Sphaerobacter sp.]
MVLPEPTTKADAAYWRLRRAIITQEIDAHQPLDEGLLMERFQVGRTPLREALKRLAAEQFIVAPPHRTPLIRPFSLTELEPLFETRMLIEVPVCGLAAERITAEELAQLQRLIDVLAETIRDGDVYRMVETDYAIHSHIAHATKNRFLADAINRFNLTALRLWYLAHSKVGCDQVVETHVALVETLAARDPRAAEAMMRAHVLSSHQRVARAFISGLDPALAHTATP